MNWQPISTCHKKHENLKKHAYKQRVWEIERGSCALSYSTHRCMVGNAVTVCFKRLVSMLVSRHDQPYSTTMVWLRCFLSFCLLRSSIQCIRGSCSIGGRAAKQMLPPAELVASEARLRPWLTPGLICTFPNYTTLTFLCYHLSFALLIFHLLNDNYCEYTYCGY